MASREKIGKDFAFLKGRVDAVLLFGSHAKGKAAPRSDVDICIVAPGKDPAALVRSAWQRLGAAYDVHAFEELPLHIKMEVINHHTPLYVRDLPALHEYFYFWRKLWADEAHRQALTAE